MLPRFHVVIESSDLGLMFQFLVADCLFHLQKLVFKFLIQKFRLQYRLLELGYLKHLRLNDHVLLFQSLVLLKYHLLELLKFQTCQML